MATYLHQMADGFSLGEDFAQIFGSENVSERGGREKPGGSRGVLHIGDGHGGVIDAIVDDSIHGHCHGIFRKNLKDAKPFIIASE